MTINDLIKQIPYEYHDCLITIFIPSELPRDMYGKEYPLIHVNVDTFVDKPAHIILEADTYK